MKMPMIHGLLLAGLIGGACAKAAETSAAANADLARMASYRVDGVDVGTAGDEERHALAADKSAVRPGREGRPARFAQRGGAFSYRLKTDAADVPQFLHLRHSGDDRAPAGEKYLFEILLNGQPFAVQGLDRNRPNCFVDEYRSLPASVLGREVEVGFRPVDGKTSVGGVYAVAVVREKRADDSGRFDRLSQWRGAAADGTATPLPAAWTYAEPDGPRGWNQYGWQMRNDGVADLWPWWGLEFDVELDGGGASLAFTGHFLRFPKEDRDTGDLLRSVTLDLANPGRQTVGLAFADFLNPSADVSGVLPWLKRLGLEARPLDPAKPVAMKLHGVRRLAAAGVALSADRRSQPVAAGADAVYTLEVANPGKRPAAVVLSVQRENWEAMTVAIEPSRLVLGPDESARVRVTVSAPAKLPPGAREEQRIQATADGDASRAATLNLITFVRRPAPYLLHDAAGWAGIRATAASHEWAGQRRDRYVESATEWKVPEVAAFRLSPDTRRPCLVSMAEELRLMDAGIAWQLTGDKRHAEKAALFLRRVCDPVNGFARTHQVGHQSEVQEGHMFQHLAQGYDLIRDAGVLADADEAAIRAAFRRYCDTVRRTGSHPAGANWAVSVQLGALMCALALEDLALAEEFTFGPGMLTDKLSSYTMSDGWWYECSIGYNLWCAEEFVQMALAMERFGYSLLHRRYPVNFASAPDHPLDDATELDQRRNVHYGHSFRIFGNLAGTTVTIKDMFDAMIPYIDYRGWIFGINDSTETNVGGGRFELAYYAFRDPRYAAFIKKAPQRDNLLYGVPDLPVDTPAVGVGSAHSDNVGLLMLRSSQAAPRERIQAVLKYGTHGGYHGHYDRTGLLSLMRYGRSFFNPEMVWYSYQPFMYNFYVQSSIAKNMVTVDLKQQEVDDSARVLFGGDDFLQAGAVETTSSWSNPAYGGLRWGHIGFPTFSSKTAGEGRHVPIPDPEPRYGAMSGFTEPVFQRRLMGVTDDYVVLADYARGETPHDYDALFQIKGLLGIAAERNGIVRTTPSLDADPLRSGQFVTRCVWRDVEGTATASFLTRFGPGADNAGTRIHGEPGPLYLNVHYAWPNAKRTLFTGLAPEEHGVRRKLSYQVKGDGKVLAEGAFGAWILGEGRVDVPLAGVKTLELSSAIERRHGKANTLFWADAALATADGKTLRLVDLKPLSGDNVLPNAHGPEKDFAGGPIAIAGTAYAFGLSAEPDKTGENRPAVHRFDLEGLDAARLVAVIGGDYPVGDEAERRVTLGVRQTGTSARFLTVVEPFERESVIAGVEAVSADEMVVTLKDGRAHRWTTTGMEGDKPSVTLKETDAAGKALRAATVAP